MAIKADIHVHPVLNTWLFGKNPLNRGSRPPFFLPVLNYVDFPRAREAGMGLLCSILYVIHLPWQKRLAAIEKLIGKTRELCEHSNGTVRVVRSAAEIRKAAADNALAILHAVEGGHTIGSDMENVDYLATLGVRYMTLVHFIHNRLGGAAFLPFGGKRGLTKFGKQVVRRMYKNGIIADLSHTTEPSFYDAVAESSGPVIASHSGAREFALRDRNLTADQAKAIASTGGVIGVILCPFYLKNRTFSAGIKELVRNIAYFTDLVSAEHVAVGSDLDGWLWPVGGVGDITGFGGIAAALEDAGFHNAEIELIMGESFVQMLERFDSTLPSLSVS